MATNQKSTRDTNGFFDYQRKIRTAKLLMKEKNLLWLYTSMYDWEKQAPSFMSLPTLAAWSGMSEASVNRAKKKLKDLGWIKDYRPSRYSPVYVWVQAGIGDPAYDHEGLSTNHFYKSTKSTPTIEMAEGLDEFDLSRMQSGPSIEPREVPRLLGADELDAW